MILPQGWLFRACPTVDVVGGKLYSVRFVRLFVFVVVDRVVDRVVWMLLSRWFARASLVGGCYGSF